MLTSDRYYRSANLIQHRLFLPIPFDSLMLFFCYICPESGPSCSALPHDPSRGTAGRAAESPGRPGGVTLPHAVG